MTVHLLFYDFLTVQKQKPLVCFNIQGVLIIVGNCYLIHMYYNMLTQLRAYDITSCRPYRRRPLEAYQLFHLQDRQLTHTR